MKRKNLARINNSDPKAPKLDFLSVNAFRSDIRDFKHDKLVWVIIEDYSPKRSLEANSLWHLWVDEIATECGQDKDDVKNTLKMMFCLFPLLDKYGEDQWNPKTGEKLMFVKDTSALTKAEMLHLMDETRMFALEFWGMELKSINEQSELKFKDNY